VKREESDLYGLPLDEFVPQRTELEKRLRKDGDRERAAAVKKLPKPSVAAWAVNQASRCRPKERRALLAASKELREVQERLLAGDASAAELEKAVAAQREAIDGLVEAASGLLTSEGKSMAEATITRVRETFAAVATDPELAELVEAGTLDRERQATGLGFGGLAEATQPAAKSAGSAKRAAAETEREKKARAAAKERVKALKKDEREAKRRLDAAERDARKAAEQLAKRERQLEEARAGAQEAREALDAARSAHEEAVSATKDAEAAA
jgi:hypothetical protein